MSFRKFGGLKYSAKHNSVSSYYNTSNNLQVTTIGQPNTYIVVESGLTGNINTNTVPDNAWIEAAIQAAVQAALKGLTPTEIIGHAGPTGPQGIEGPTGLRGLEGSKGIEGPTGSQGVEGLRGLEGPTGSQGVEGLRGLEGPTGSQGIQGIQGLQGPQGVPGPAGPPGPTSGTSDSSTIFTLKDARKSIDIIGPLILQASADGTITVPTSYSRDVPNIIDIVSVSVGTDVTSIGDYAFQNAKSLTSITIPNTVINIGDYAFQNATSLPSITIPNTVKNIGNYAFYQASGLKTVTFAQDSQLMNIEDFAFSGPNMLTSIEIPNTVTNIGDYAFNTANKLTEINVPVSVTTIGTRAFGYAASLRLITVDSNNKNYSADNYGVLFNKTTTTLIQYPNGNTQTLYKIPNTVTTIGVGAFENTTNLQSIDVPILVTSIDPKAFTSSGVKTAVFEKSSNLVTPLGLKIGSNQPFYGATGVTISVVGQTDFTLTNTTTTQGIDIQGILENKSYNSIIPLNNIKSVTVGANVSSIGASAFKDAISLQSITIPSSVISIGDLAFQNTIKLTEIIVDPNNNKYLSESDSGVLFNKEKTTLIQYPIGKGQTSYDIPNTVTNISNNAFQNATSLTTVTFAKDSKLQSIGAYAFQNAKILQSIDVPASVTDISNNAFQNASSLTTVTFAKDSKLQSIGAYAFDSATILESIEVPASVTSIGNYAFQSVKKLKTVTFAKDSKLDSIGDYAFNYARGFWSIEIPASVTIIGQSAFNNAQDLTTVTFAKDSRLRSIGQGAFYMLGGLKSIEIPASVESIGEGAFSFNNWSSLETVTFAAGSKLTGIQAFTFNYADKLKSIIIPSSVTSIGAGAFRLTKNLQSITIPSSVTRIETNNNQGPAFDMSGLKTVFFESSSSLTTFKVSIGPGKSFFGASNVTISVVGQTEFTLTNGTITSLDIKGVLTPKSYTIDVNTISKISVGTYVTSIGDNAFNSAKTLTTVTFAQGSQLGSIGENAFQNATSLTSIIVPTSVTSIGDYAFYGATSLTSITIPVSVTSIGGSKVFYGSGLKTVVFDSITNYNSLSISNGFTFGNNQTFFGATGVTISVLGKTSFRLTDGKIISITISGTLTQSSYSSITLNNIESVIVGSTVISIDSRAFQGATSLKSITIPNNVTNIGDYAFQNATSLNSITIPISVKSIGGNAFSNSGLKTVVFDSITNVISLGFTIGSGQTFYGAQGVTISASDYKPTAAVTKYYYPGVDSSPIPPLDTSGYTRCDVLIVGSGGNAGTVTYRNYGTSAPVPIFDLGGAGGGGGSASFTNITCNPLGGNIQFSITQSGSSWVLNKWVKDGTSLSCQLTAENGSNGVNPWGSPPITTPVTGGAGGTSSGSSTGLPSGVVLTTNTGAKGSTGIYGWSWEPTSFPPLPDSYPPLPSGGKPGDILPNFKSPSSQNNNSMGYGSGYQQISGAFNVTMFSSGQPFTIKGQAQGPAFIQVNLYNAP